MTNISKITDAQLLEVRQQLEKNGAKVRAWQIREAIKNLNGGLELDESTIRGRFIEMGQALSGSVGTPPLAKVKVASVGTAISTVQNKVYQVPDELKRYIPTADEFANYIERPVDKRLAIHYETSKYPLTQGKQGTGKTTGHAYYAYKKQLPFFLICCHPDFKLHTQFGDKTIENGNVVFKESLLVKAFQNPSVILFDEINRIEEKEGAAFHALLQNRELYIKDADNGNGKIYNLHPDCKIGFAMNPKSAKYIGVQVKNSAFLGRCTFITYPDFTSKEIETALIKKFPTLMKDDLKKFSKFYFACVETIEKANVPVDISIRQLNNVVDLWLHGLPLKESIEDGMTSIMEAVSQPKAKESFFRLAQAIWRELMQESQNEKVETAAMALFLLRLRR